MPRPNLGDRHPVAVRPPRDQWEIYRDRADELGLDLGNYMVLVMACAHGKPVPDYIADKLADGAWSAYKDRAAELGVALGDYMVLVMACVHGTPIPEDIAKQFPADLLPHDAIEAKVA
ncbi:hypothetical protein AB0N05_37820 [Nocardia sp. NPDC051030]|uniref:hypothetical protein n=1 Tax=Nocardia sp. NPDC051030 TaxID=3155162 RepID=UPI00344647BB